MIQWMAQIEQEPDFREVSFEGELNVSDNEL